jgi:hypothetical protein
LHVEEEVGEEPAKGAENFVRLGAGPGVETNEELDKY